MGGGEFPHCHYGLICVQHTSYLVKPSTAVKLPVAHMKGEQLTSVWTVDLQQRQGKKLRDGLSVKDDVSLAMCPDDLNLCFSLEGYGHQPEPR